MAQAKSLALDPPEPLMMAVIAEGLEALNDLAAEVLAAHWDERYGPKACPAWLEVLEAGQESLVEALNSFRRLAGPGLVLEDGEPNRDAMRWAPDLSEAREQLAAIRGAGGS